MVVLEDYFKYHPILTTERIEAHDAINKAAYEFAKTIDKWVKDEQCKTHAIFSIQQARMFANQGATVDELYDELPIEQRLKDSVRIGVREFYKSHKLD